VLAQVSNYYSTPLELPEQAGYFTAMGALLTVAEAPTDEDGVPRP
jgi:hypothetical protein